TFVVFVSGPNGTSQNLTTLPAGSSCPAGFVGNQQGILVTIKCNAPPTPAPQPNSPTITNATLTTSASGLPELDVIGTGFSSNAVVSVNGVNAKITVMSGLDTGSNAYTKASVTKKACKLLKSGHNVITVTNSDGKASNGYTFNQKCQ